MKQLLVLCTAALLGGSLAISAQQTPPPAGAQQQQPPQGGRGGRGPQPPPKNLQVLPKDLTRRQVTDIMRGFARGLGVRCPYCHVGEEGADLSTFDFASDEKPTKATARVMLKMLAKVNDDLSMVGQKPMGEPRVTCYTCHRGETKPVSAPPAAGG